MSSRRPNFASNIPSPTSIGSGLGAFWLLLVDAGIAAIIFLGPLFMGGRHPLGYMIYASVAFATLLAWTIRQATLKNSGWVSTAADWVLLAALSLVVVQLLPLPQSWLLSVSPMLAKYLPLWFDNGTHVAHLGDWSTVSLIPAATRSGLVMFLSYAAFFLVVVQRVEGRRDVERLLKWVAVAAFGMGVLGLVQFFFGNGHYLWIYQNPERSTFGAVKGTFFNENHMAHFLALGVAPLLWWISTLPTRQASDATFGSLNGTRRAKNDTARMLLAAALIVVSVAALFTFSRGGLIAAFIAGAICISIYVGSGILGRRSLYGLAAIGLVVAGAVIICGHETLMWQLHTLTSGSMEKLDANNGRRRIWAADSKVVADYPWFGSGVGTHVEVYKQYFPEFSSTEYVYAECSYLQALVETGFVGLTLMLAALALAIYWCVRIVRSQRSPETKALGAAVLGSVLGSSAHALFDFAWFIPACLSMLSIQVACICRLVRLGDEKRTDAASSLVLPRWGWTVAAATVFGLGIFAAQNRIGPVLASAEWERVNPAIKTIIRSGSSLMEASDDEQTTIINALTNVIAKDPTNSRAHLEAAMVCMSAFNSRQQQSENPMELIHIRDAALKSRFASKSLQDQWLNAVLGSNRAMLDQALHHARRSVELCPLHGEGYAYLAQLAFLEGADAQANAALIDQALLVRPYNGEVLIVAGTDAAFESDPVRQINYWKQAFERDPRVQQRLIALLGTRLSARDFLKDMPVDLSAARILLDLYQRSQRRDDALLVAARLIELNQKAVGTASSTAAAELWHEAQQTYWFLGEREKSVECARRAMQHAPEVFRWHRELATRLTETGQFEEAIDELKWCISRAPDDTGLQSQLLQLARRNLDEQPGATRAAGKSRSRRR